MCNLGLRASESELLFLGLLFPSLCLTLPPGYSKPPQQPGIGKSRELRLVPLFRVLEALFQPLDLSSQVLQFLFGLAQALAETRALLNIWLSHHRLHSSVPPEAHTVRITKHRTKFGCGLHDMVGMLPSIMAEGNTVGYTCYTRIPRPAAQIRAASRADGGGAGHLDALGGSGWFSISIAFLDRGEVTRMAQ